jgi:tight adherence protein B
MSAESAVLELAGLLRSGMPAPLARAELENQLAKLSAHQLAQFDALWSTALASGGSIAGATQALGESFHANARHRREIEVAFAGPKATARLVAVLPLAGLLLAQLFGLNPLKAIFTNGLAMVALIFGLILLIAGRVWTRSILDKAAPDEVDDGLYFDSIRLGLLAGLPLVSAVEAAGLSMQSNLSVAPDLAAQERVKRLAEINRTSGASIAQLLESEANARREAQRFQESDRLAKLSIRLLIPLGAVTLPAFVLSTIVPISISLLTDR